MEIIPFQASVKKEDGAIFVVQSDSKDPSDWEALYSDLKTFVEKFYTPLPPPKLYVCETCGKPAHLRSGKKEDGTSWSGLFCTNSECKHVQWNPPVEKI